jgi:D-proline reductase (dithiol) PrdB
LISSGGVHARNDRPFDVCHSFGDFRFRRVPSQLCHEELIIHQLKYPHDDGHVDINVLPDRAAPGMAAEGVRGVLTDISAVSSAIAMEPEKFERTVARDIAEVVVSERKADVALLAPV